MGERKVNMALDISFSIETKNEFEEVTKEECLLGLLKRVASLMEHWEPEAFGFVDEYDLEEG